jgi:signal transduction histidine kinase
VLGAHGITDEVAAFIPEEVDRLDHILTGYLSFGAGRQAEREEFDIALVVRRSLGLLRDELAAAGVALDVADDLPVAPVSGDPRRLQQVLLNLLINARDAMPGGGAVGVAVTVGGSRVRVTLVDEGPGLAPAVLAKVFEPFWTSKEKGSGLGLAMSRRIMEDMDGGLDLRNRVDRPGAVAELWAPLATQENGQGD